MRILWRRWVGLGAVVAAAIVAFGLRILPSEPPVRPVSAPRPLVTGLVIDEEGPVVGATVRVKGTAPSTLSDERGRFQLAAVVGDRLTASKAGYFIVGTNVAEDRPTRIALSRHSQDDDSKYSWIDPRPEAIAADRCVECHSEVYNEWATSAHARSATNTKFINVYDGTDAQGNAAIGWNVLHDYPEGAGVCAACHVPSLRATIESLSDLRAAAGVDRLGIHCDFCHKVANVADTQIGLAHGRYALRIIRPGPTESVVFGPLDDVDRGDSVYAPIMRDSRFCASCHEGIVFGTHAYSTYSEWLESPYSKAGKHCQHCHMQPTGAMTNFAPAAGGIERDPLTLASHATLGNQPDFVRRHVTLSLSVVESDQTLEAIVEVRADGVGHRTPTGHPSRQLILWIEGIDARHQPLELTAGPRLPSLAGHGPVANGGLAGRPGKLYAKALADPRSGAEVPYWRPAEVAFDNRLAPDGADRLRFAFRRVPGSCNVTATLLYRRFSKAVADEKAWTDNEFVIATQTTNIR